MDEFEHGFSLPADWYNDPQAKCYKNMITGDTFCYSEELFCFADPLPTLILLKDVETTHMEMGDKSSETEEPATETAPERVETINMEMGDKSSETEEPALETPAMETAPKRKDLPLRLYFGNGPRIHSRMCIEYGVVNKRCEDCGQVGKLACFSSSFRKWALKRVTEEEFNQICSRCHLRGHTYLNCDIPATYRVDGVPVPQEKKTQ
ncbi:uncharacterized protein LOC130728218 [Lotus japonicus]|uniref:uncharacterized protein LOC130728218 n=1 Tax=Lotus japonicus TaxID=34305 RepID=UPI002585AD0C|nr:uncharacterized protein LOC130728218 [Lotus japonicus]